MTSESKASRLEQMGVPRATVDRLNDLAEAYYDAKVGTLIAEALEMFIESRLKSDRGMADRFQTLQKRRTR